MNRERACFNFDNSAGRSCCSVFFQAYIFFKVRPLRNCRRDPNRNISQAIIPHPYVAYLGSIVFNLAYVSSQQYPSSASSTSIDLGGAGFKFTRMLAFAGASVEVAVKNRLQI